MKRISVTTLEKFRRYIKEVSSFDTEEALLDTIKGIFKGNDKTKFGSAYHKIIEGEYTKTKGGLLVTTDGEQFILSESICQPGISFKKNHPLMIHEINVDKIYDIDGTQYQVIGRTDGMEGTFVRDVKTKFRSPSYEEYYNSYQWRFYLDMFDLSVFYYDLFEIVGFESLPAHQPYIINDVTVIAHEPYECISYMGMEEDLQSLLYQFIEYVKLKGLEQYLKPAIEKPFF